MAARQPLALVGGAIEAYSTGDDARFNSLGIGAAATGSAGVLNFTVAARGPDGSLSAPAFAFTSEPNTGLRLAAAGLLRVVVQGADEVTIQPGLVTIGTAATFTSSLHTFSIGGSERMRLDGSGTLVVNPGTTPTDGLMLNMAQPGVAGTRDSHMLILRGTSYDTAGHNADWRHVVDVTSNAGASTYLWQSRIDAATFATQFSLTDTGLVTLESATLPVLSSTRTSAATNTALVAGRLTHKTTADMVDGLAVGLSFAVQDATSANETLAAVYGRRSGADNTGRLDFYVSAAGVQNRRWSILDTGELVAAADNAVDIGQTGAVRPRQVYLAAAPAQTDSAVRADEAAIPIGATAGTLTSAGGATKYSGPYTTQPNTTETSVSFLVPHAMVLRNLRVRAQAAPTGASVLFTAMVNEVANTALEVDYLTTSSGTVSDAVGSITLAGGDRLSIKIVMNTGYNDNSMTDVRWSLDATRL